MITREAMERIVAKGGSVLYHGVVISSIADLPSVAALAQGDPAKEAVAIVALTAQMQALQADIARLRPAGDAVRAQESLSFKTQQVLDDPETPARAIPRGRADK